MFKQIKFRSSYLYSLKSLSDLKIVKLQKFNFNYFAYFKQFYYLTFFDNVPPKQNLENNYYTTRQPFIFINGKLSLINTENSNLVISNKNFIKNLKVLLASMIICGLTAYYISCFKLVAICAISSVGVLIFTHQLHKTFYRIVKQINLLENGKFVEIVTLANKFEVDIKNLNKPNKLQVATFNLFFPDLISFCEPLIIEDDTNKGIYLIPSEKEIEYNKELINAIIHKSYVIAKNKIGNNDNIIEIEV